MRPTPPRGKPLDFGLFRFRSPLLTESHSLSFPPLTEMFHFSGCRSAWTMNSSRSHWVHQWGFPIRRSPGQRLLPSHRGLSQVTASFIASQHQGIHLVPLVAYLNVSTYHSNIYYWRRTKLHGIFSMQGCQRTTAPSGMEGTKFVFRFRRVVGQAGFEPATPRLSSACSNQLSYRPCFHRSGCGLVELRRFELLTSCLQSRRSTN